MYRGINIDFKKSFNGVFNVFKILGLYFLNEEPKLNHKIYSLIINIPLMFLFNFAQIINLFHLNSDLRKIAASGYVVAISCMANVKSFYLFKHRDVLINILNDLNEGIFQPRDLEGIELAKKSLSTYRMVKKIVFVMSTISLLSCMTTPILIKKADQSLPVASWYPFDVSASPVYEIIYFYQCVSVTFVTYTNIYLDIMVVALTTFVGIQCDLLSQNMKNRQTISSMNEFVAHHKRILQFAKNTEALITEIYFFQFIAHTMALCMTLFLLSVVEQNSFEFFYLINYQAAMLCLLLVPCWFSSEMKRKSQKLSQAVYSLPWISTSNSIKKDTMFFLQRAQVPIDLHVMNLFTLSVDTFMKIVRSSFSYYTVLNNLNKK